MGAPHSNLAAGLKTACCRKTARQVSRRLRIVYCYFFDDGFGWVAMLWLRGPGCCLTARRDGGACGDVIPYASNRLHVEFGRCGRRQLRPETANLKLGGPPPKGACLQTAHQGREAHCFPWPSFSGPVHAYTYTCGVQAPAAKASHAASAPHAFVILLMHRRLFLDCA